VVTSMIIIESRLKLSENIPFLHLICAVRFSSLVELDLNPGSRLRFSSSSLLPVRFLFLTPVWTARFPP
jgi:hypothetical protein